MQTKKWYLSKTVILNLCAGIIAIIAMLNEETLVKLGFADTKQILQILGAITTVLNIVLRVFSTSLPIIPRSSTTTSSSTIDWPAEISNCTSLDQLGALVDLPYEYYGLWCDHYMALNLPLPFPPYTELGAGTVGTSGPKK